MLCRTARTWVYLYRPDELSGPRKRRLERHLARCPECAAEAGAADRAGRFVAGLRSQVPRMHDANGFTLTVARGVAGTELHIREPNPLLPRLRTWQWASGVGVIAIVLVFVVQVSSDASKVAALEERLHGSPGRADAGGVGVREALRRTPLRDADRMQLLRAELFVPWNPLEALKGVQLFGRDDREAFLQHVAAKYPRLASITVDDGLDDREREILATEGTALMEELESILSQEGPPK